MVHELRHVGISPTWLRLGSVIWLLKHRPRNYHESTLVNIMIECRHREKFRFRLILFPHFKNNVSVRKTFSCQPNSPFPG